METLIIKSFAGQISDVDEKGVIVKAVNAFGNEDAHNDISMPGSFTKTIQERGGRLRWYLNHKQNELLGVPLESTPNDQYLIQKSRINLNKQIGKDTYEDYKMYAAEGKSLEHSIGVVAVKRNPANKKEVLEWKWFEYSTLTNWGANPNTPVLSIKSGIIDLKDEDILEHIYFLEKCLKVANYSDEKGRQIEDNIASIKALINGEPSTDTQTIKEPQFDIKEALKTIKIKL